MIDPNKVIGKITVNNRNIPISGHIEVTNASGYSIITGDIADTTITLYDSDNQVVSSQTTPAVTGGMITFAPTATGNYTVTATRGGVQVWTKSVRITSVGVNYIGAGDLASYSAADLHTICQNGYARAMFKKGDIWNYTSTGSILNNYAFFIEDIETVDNKDVIRFRMCNKYTGATYMINPKYARLSSASATSFSADQSSIGGYKYSELRRLFMKQGEAVYMQATGIIPDDSTCTTGIKFSEIFYTDGNGSKSGVYSYQSSSDSFSEDAEWSTVSQTTEKFLKGYFKSVGTIDETTFNSGYYYLKTVVSSANVYTRATAYDASATYYGFYETLQEDGIFVDALSSISSYLVRFSDYSCTGLQETSLSLTEDFANIPSVEELVGLNKTSVLKSGVSAQNIGCYNIVGEGHFKEVYKYDFFATGADYWTRSTYTNTTSTFCYVYNFGYIGTNGVYYSYGVRVGFRLG